MLNYQKPTGRALSLPMGLAFGAMISIIITLMSAILMGYLLNTEKMLWESSGYGIMLSLLIASFAGSKASFSRIKRQCLLVSLLSGMVFFGILLSATALFFGGQYEGAAVTGLLILAGSGTAGLLHNKKSGRGKVKGGRKSYC